MVKPRQSQLQQLSSNKTDMLEKLLSDTSWRRQKQNMKGVKTLAEELALERKKTEELLIL